MNVSAPFRQLVDRKLWPVALLLLGALLAVPVLLAKSSAPAVPVSTAAPQAAATADPMSEPVVQLADASRTDRRRTVLGSAKNPFRPAAAPRVKKSNTQTTSESQPTQPTNTGTGGAPSTPPVTTPPAVVAPTVPKKTFELYSLMVRFGDSANEVLPKQNLKRLKSMPTTADPVIIYLGLMRDRRTAVFLVDAKAKVQGDGVCDPDPANCQTLRLKVGETAFFDTTDENGTVQQYQLDIIRVAKKKTADAQAARRSRYHTAKGGRDALRPRVARAEGYRYDPDSGVVVRTSD